MTKEFGTMNVNAILKQNLLDGGLNVIPRYVAQEDVEKTYADWMKIVNAYFEEKDPFDKRLNFLHGLDLMCDKFARLSFQEFRNAMGDMLVEVLDW